MASREKVDGFGTVITLSPAEALELVTLLAGQIAKLPCPGCASGAAPQVKIDDRGLLIEKIHLVVDHNMK